jgi:hypothetical protein
MAISNYSELKAAIADWLNRTDLETRIPDFILLAESAIFRTLRSTNNEKLTVFLQGDTGITDITKGIPVPEDYLAPKLITYNGRPLQRVSEARYLELLQASNASKQPAVYTRINDQLLFYPTADQAAEVQLWYYFRHPALGSSSTPDTDTNKTLELSPDLYLFGALLQAQAYLIGDERLSIWGTQYQVAMDAQNNLSTDEDYLGSTIETLSAYEM